MESEDYSPTETFLTSSGAAEELGVTRAAIGDAVKRGALKPDAVLYSPKKQNVPIFRHATIQRYREVHLRKTGNRVTPIEPREKTLPGVLADYSKLYLSVDQQVLLIDGLKSVIERLRIEIAYAKDARVSTEKLDKMLNRILTITEIHEKAIKLGKDISDEITPVTVGILVAAMEVSARQDEAFADELEEKGRSRLTATQVRERATQKRAVFNRAWWEQSPWRDQLADWGFQP